MADSSGGEGGPPEDDEVVDEEPEDGNVTRHAPELRRERE
eukprot:CAMPEP_0205961176 /NCGR_PEP_ID=MMETSP1459-20131121/65477_1 /ASSEMBLY_ACC=CAM_ASM_001120 /TAXON_ID=41880 /ORGANISM="Pycnococcus provasolii, Strain RCC931" /LENGTH=39 /DNA_ID= /DNA_START= /DNA_END= /DNA_ORIENTATION=